MKTRVLLLVLRGDHYHLYHGSAEVGEQSKDAPEKLALAEGLAEVGLKPVNTMVEHCDPHGFQKVIDANVEKHGN